jgi:GNAT superfamily N-acetyltransferase
VAALRISIAPLTDVEAAFEIGRVCWLAEMPDIPFFTPAEYAVRIGKPRPGHLSEHYLGFLDGVPVGLLELAMPQHDNREAVYVDLIVLPDHRRQGVGRALWELAVRRTREMGRRHLIGPTTQSRPDGAAFATAVGAIPGLAELRSRLDLTTLDEALLPALLADAWTHAQGYQLIQWVGMPADDIIDDVAYLESRLYSDAPMGDLALEPEKVDAERIRQTELSLIERGRVCHHSGVLHDGRLVGWTVISGATATPEHAWQQITLVDPDHRGHRLGMLVKLANLAYIRARQPQLTAIDTYNAAANEHMLRINLAMGFRPVDTVIEWQLTL